MASTTTTGDRSLAQLVAPAILPQWALELPAGMVAVDNWRPNRLTSDVADCRYDALLLLLQEKKSKATTWHCPLHQRLTTHRNHCRPYCG